MVIYIYIIVLYGEAMGYCESISSLGYDQHHEGLSSDIGGIEPKDAGSHSAVMGQYGTDDWIYPILVE